jgi:hypothetical protein
MTLFPSTTAMERLRMALRGGGSVKRDPPYGRVDDAFFIHQGDGAVADGLAWRWIGEA